VNKRDSNIVNNPKVAIVILNWNGFKDTIDCLSSLSNSNYQNFEIILVDNASTDGSVGKIKKWLTDTLYKKIQIIECPLNYGFAKGNNIGIQAAINNKTDYILLLNNDTVVTPNFMSELITFFNNNINYSVATPQIRYFNKQEIIWNCGGKLSNYGTRKYFFDDKHYTELPDKNFVKISFITGCSIIMRTSVIEKIGKLTENFFFGEEDFEFSMRLKKNKINAACVLNSLIYHKVNSSISKTSELIIGKIFINYLSRFINMKSFMPSWKWQLWRHSYILYIVYLLKFRYKFSFKTIRIFLSCLLSDSLKLNGVDKAIFDKYINFDFSSKPV